MLDRDRHLPLDEVRRLDARLGALGRGQAALRLRVGELAEVMGVRGWFAEVGFARVGDYALERCGKPIGWLTECRSVARRLAALPALRAAVCGGELSWSMAVLCAPKTTPEREADVLARAKTSTVRQMRTYFGQTSPVSPVPETQPEPGSRAGSNSLDPLARCDEEETRKPRDAGATSTAGACGDARTCTASGGGGGGVHGGGVHGGGGAHGGRGAHGGTSSARADERERSFHNSVVESSELDEDAACVYDRARRRTLRRTVPEAVVYKLEATRILLDHLEGGVASYDAIIDAMLDEAQTKLEVNIDLPKLHGELQCADEARRRSIRTQRASDEEAEARCETRLPPRII